MLLRTVANGDEYKMVLKSSSSTLVVLKVTNTLNKDLFKANLRQSICNLFVFIRALYNLCTAN